MSLVLRSMAGAALGLCAASAQAATPWYVSGSVGGYFRQDSDAYFASADASPFTTLAHVSAHYGFGFAEGGLSLPLSSSLSIVPAYRFVHYFRSTQDVAHVVKAALRYSF